MAVCARSILFCYARDRAVPLSNLWQRVDKTFKGPIYAVRRCGQLDRWAETPVILNILLCLSCIHNQSRLRFMGQHYLREKSHHGCIWLLLDHTHAGLGRRYRGILPGSPYAGVICGI
jgi:hypothetical protein